MDEITIAVQLDLALHLGLAALTVTLLIWRLGETKETFEYVIAARKLQLTGFASANSLAALRILVLSLFLRMVGACIAAASLYSSLRYILVTEDLVGPMSSALDSGLFFTLWRESENITGRAISLSFLAALILLVDYILSFCIPLIGAGEIRLPKMVHPFVIPRQWTAAPAAMWEERIRLVLGSTELSDELRRDLDHALASGGWRSDWTLWAKSVAAYTRHSCDKASKAE